MRSCKAPIDGSASGPSRVFLTQPFDGGQVRDWTWAQAIGEARRMAAWLVAQNWEPGTRIAIFPKTAPGGSWPISPSGWPAMSACPFTRRLKRVVRQILEHSEAKACFLGSTDERKRADGFPPGIALHPFPTAPDRRLSRIGIP